MSYSFENKVVRASAGSGKTFKLSERFLKLILCGEPVDSILATTFTRKAAGEIKARVFARLGLGAASAEGAEKLRQELCDRDDAFAERVGLTPENARRVFQHKLVDLVREPQRARVCTLDSFFMQIAGGYAFELGLPPNWNIVEELEDRLLMRSALLEAFAQADLEAAVTLARALFKGEFERSVERQIAEIVGNSLEIFRESPPSAWTRLEEGLDSALDYDSLCEKLQLARANLDVEVEAKRVDGRIRKSADTFIALFLGKDWDNLNKNGLLDKARNGKSFYNKPIPEDLVDAVLQSGNYARQLKFAEMSKVLRATWNLLDVAARSFDEAKREKGAYRFEDLTRLISELQLADKLRQIVYRLDSKISHVLLDEFQDASFPQWKIIKPFALSAVTRRVDESTGRIPGSFYCVGDVKQAIYGWRGGRAEIFDSIERDLPNVASDSMAINWRSCPTIIDAVNELFENIRENPALAGGDGDESASLAATAIRKAVLRWSKGFETHRVAPKNESLPGHWSLEQAPTVEKNDGGSFISVSLDPIDAAAPRAEDEPKPEMRSLFDDGSGDDESDANSASGISDSSLQKQATMLYVVERVYQLRKRRPRASIGVLARTNKAIAQIISKLKERFRGEDVEISEEGGSPIADSPAVDAALAVLQMAARSGDSVARYRVATIEPLSKKFNLTPENFDAPFKGQDVSRRARKELETKGLGDFLSEIRDLLLPVCPAERDKERLDKLVEFAYGYNQRVDELSLDRFILAAREFKAESPSAATLRVMSLHKSKGLEFDIVVLPDLADNINRVDLKKIYVHRDKSKGELEAPVDAAVKYVSESLLEDLPEPLDEWLPETFADQTTSRVQEALNLLYVGLTRPVRELVAIVPPKSRGGKTLTSAKILVEGFAGKYVGDPSALANDPRPQILCQFGDPNWDDDESAERESRTPESLEPQAPITNRDLPQGAPARRLLFHRKTPTGGRESLRWTPGTRFRDGSAIHACFERVEWLDRGGVPSKEELDAAIRPFLFDPAQVGRVAQRFRDMCGSEFVQKLLSQSSYPGFEVKALRETPFSRTEGGDLLVRGTIDRLVLLYKEGKLVAADVIDFKTDRYKPSEETYLEYRAQLGEYAKAVERRTGLSREQITVRLAFVAEDWPDEERNYIIE